MIAAAKNGDICTRRLLLNHEANIEAQDHDGDTALTYGTGNGQGQTVVANLLRSRGAKKVIHRVSNCDTGGLMEIFLILPEEFCWEIDF